MREHHRFDVGAGRHLTDLFRCQVFCNLMLTLGCCLLWRHR